MILEACCSPRSPTIRCISGSVGHAARQHQLSIAVFIIFILVCYVGMVYGSVGAFLAEFFPGRIATSVSVPYHIGNGWGGGWCRSSPRRRSRPRHRLRLIYPIAVPRCASSSSFRDAARVKTASGNRYSSSSGGIATFTQGLAALTVAFPFSQCRAARGVERDVADVRDMLRPWPAIATRRPARRSNLHALL